MRERGVRCVFRNVIPAFWIDERDLYDVSIFFIFLNMVIDVRALAALAFGPCVFSSAIYDGLQTLPLPEVLKYRKAEGPQRERWRRPTTTTPPPSPFVFFCFFFFFLFCCCFPVPLSQPNNLSARHKTLLAIGVETRNPHRSRWPLAAPLRSAGVDERCDFLAARSNTIRWPREERGCRRWLCPPFSTFSACKNRAPGSSSTKSIRAKPLQRLQGTQKLLIRHNIELVFHSCDPGFNPFR